MLKRAIICECSSPGWIISHCAVLLSGHVQDRVSFPVCERFALLEHGLEDGDDCFREIYKAVGYAVAPLPLPTCPNLLCGNSVAWKLIVPEGQALCRSSLRIFAASQGACCNLSTRS